MRLEPRGPDAGARYEIEGFAGPLGRGDPPMVSSVAPLPSGDGGPEQGALLKEMTGRELMEQGLPVNSPRSLQAIWMVYRRVKAPPRK